MHAIKRFQEVAGGSQRRTESDGTRKQPRAGSDHSMTTNTSAIVPMSVLTDKM